MKIVRIGTRDSRLAVEQAHRVMEAIRRYDWELVPELVLIKSLGDREQDAPLDQLGGKGAFVKGLDRALAAGEVDLCVHSLKDMPVEDDPRFPIVAVSEREDPRDALVMRRGTLLIDPDKPVGCSSQRRRAYLKKLHPKWRVRPVRGNISTRLEKLDAGEYGALVLAAAGLKRLQLAERITRYFSLRQMLPAAGQGIVAVQGRAGEPYAFLSRYHSVEAWDMALAERHFVRMLGAGCSLPVAANALIRGERLLLRGMFVDEAGNMREGELEGHRRDAEQIGMILAARLMHAAPGAEEGTSRAR